MVAKRHRNSKWGLVMKCPMLRMWLTARENREGYLSTSCWRSWRRHSIHSLSMSQYIYFCFSISDTLPLQTVCLHQTWMYSLFPTKWLCLCEKVSLGIKHHYQSLKYWNCVCLSHNDVWINPLKSHCAMVTFLAALSKNK